MNQKLLVRPAGSERLRELERKHAEDKAAAYHRQKQRVVVFTENTVIEGTIYIPEGVRLSDALNSPAGVNQRYVPLTDVRVVSLADGKEILESRVILLHHHYILGIVPGDELRRCCAFECGADADAPPRDGTERDEG